MKYLILTVSIFALSLQACQEPEETTKENKDLLSTDLVNNPRSAAGTDTAALKSLATMDFTDTLFDFGTIHEGEIVTHDFRFTNNGKKPLIISNAAGSCGCTVADFPKEPLAPGSSEVIKVRFSSAGKHGHQEKSVSVTTNSNRGIHALYIKGEVTEEK